MGNEIIRVKGTPQYLIINIEDNYPFEEIVSSLTVYFANAKDFFNGAKFKLSTEGNKLTETQLSELKSICKNYGLVSCEKQTIQKETPPKKKNIFEIEGFKEKELTTENVFLAKNIRGGDRLNISGNVILFGDINPGSYLTATGNIIVLGSVKGVVHAGATGNDNSYIIAYNLAPQQIRIGTKIACRQEEKISDDTFKPEIAKVDKENIIIKPYLQKELP